jgi:signal transduction histidine kinase
MSSRLARIRHPRTTVRWRLTLLYGGLFLISGAVLLAITYTLVDHAPLQPNSRFGPGPKAISFQARGQIRGRVALFDRSGTVPGPNFPRTLIGPSPPSPAELQRVDKLLRSKTGQVAIRIVGINQRISDLHQLEVESVIALAVMAVISGALGWVVAGRVLAPLRTMTTATQQISEANLHQRLALEGPPDELRQLADTIDGLLGRLEGAFDAQRQFVANASHELRTPLTSARALLELVMSDPSATIASYRRTCGQVLEESAQQEQLIDALLALASSQRGLETRAPVDLAAITGGLLGARKLEAAAQGIRLAAELEPTFVGGDERLLERMVSNLLDNAIHHNVNDGSVRITVSAKTGVPRLTIVNTGPQIPPGEVERLLQPFQRLAGDRTGHGQGLGLGLSIVAAIADAHDAKLTLSPLADGGLHAAVSFPGEVARAAPLEAPSVVTEPV